MRAKWHYSTTAMWAFLGGVILCPTPSAFAEAIGFFQTNSGVQGVVTGSSGGFGPTEISFAASSGTAKIIKSLVNSSWKLEGDSVVDGTNFPSTLPGSYIGIAVEGGNFYIPSFGATYFPAARGPAKVFFEASGGKVGQIELPISGGEIKGFRVGKNGIELLIYERKSYTKKSKEGRTLFAVDPIGQNVMITVTRRQAEVSKRLSSKRSDVFWSDGDRLIGIDQDSLRIQSLE